MHKDSQWLAADLWGKIYWTSLAVDCIVNLAVGGRQEASSLALGGFLVSFSKRNGSGMHGPTVEDCERLWTTIRKELITDAEVMVIVPTLPLGQQRPCLMVASPGFDPETGAVVQRVWATRELGLRDFAITYGTLFDLLIEAHNRMQSHLGGQVAF
jgi:hypothetical protein